MHILYIDVYFLINFTVNVLALYFSSQVNSIKTGVFRLSVCATLGAFVAIADIFVHDIIFLAYAIYALFLIMIMVIVPINAGILRRVKLLILFLILEVFIGGLVNFIYSRLDTYFLKYSNELEGGVENRKLVLFSVIILLAIGVFRLFIMLYSNSSSDGVVRIEVKVGQCSADEDAMVDTGNLVKDPISMLPVLFIKESFAMRFLPENVVQLRDIDNIDQSFKKRIRLIPVTRSGATHVVTGIKPDKIYVYTQKGKEEVDVMLAIDKEGGTFGGYLALAPSVLSRYSYENNKVNNKENQ